MDGDASGLAEYLIPEEILYAFTPGAVRDASCGPRNSAIVAKWTTKLRIPSGVVSLRTRQGLYRGYAPSLSKFEQMVQKPDFERVSQSVVANLRATDSAQLGSERPKTLSYAVDAGEIAWPYEMVVVSREYLKKIRVLFGVPTPLRPRREK